MIAKTKPIKTGRDLVDVPEAREILSFLARMVVCCADLQVTQQAAILTIRKDLAGIYGIDRIQREIKRAIKAVLPDKETQIAIQES